MQVLTLGALTIEHVSTHPRRPPSSPVDVQAALSATQADAAAARAALAAASAAARAAMGKPSLELPSHEATARFQSDTAGGNIATDEVSTRRATIRLLEAEREAIADVLAGIAPLPAFVRGLSYKCGAQGDAAAVADGADVGSAGNDEQAAFTASATVTAVQSSSSQMMTRLRALAQERPLIIDALGQMDGALRGFRLERERLIATLQVRDVGVPVVVVGGVNSTSFACIAWWHPRAFHLKSRHRIDCIHFRSLRTTARLRTKRQSQRCVGSSQPCVLS